MSKDFVYVIEFEESLVKVGRSTNPDTRIKNVSSASGRKHLRTWVSPAVMDAGQLETSCHLALGEFRGHGEWFNCSYDFAVSQARSLASISMPWSQEEDSRRDQARKENFDAFFSTVFPSLGYGREADLEGRFMDRLKKQMFERSILNYMSFLEIDAQRSTVFDNQIAAQEAAFTTLGELSIDSACELIFLRALASEEYLAATMMSGVYLGQATDNCMMVLGDAEKVSGMIDVIEIEARRRLAEKEGA